MAIGDEGVNGPLVGGTRPTGTVDFVPRRPRTAPPRLRGAGRSRTALQAGVPRPAAARVPTAGAPRRPRAQAVPSGVPVRRGPNPGVTVATPRRAPRPTNVIQQGPTPSRTRAGTDARQLLAQEEERRRRIRQGGLFRAAERLRGR